MDITFHWEYSIVRLPDLRSKSTITDKNTGRSKLRERAGEYLLLMIHICIMGKQFPLGAVYLSVTCHHFRAANSPWFCRKFPENKLIFPCSDEQIWKSPWLVKLFPYYVDSNSRSLPDCFTKSAQLQECWQLCNLLNCLPEVKQMLFTHFLVDLNLDVRPLWYLISYQIFPCVL